MSATYKTILKDPAGNQIAELPDAMNMTHSWYLNASGAATFSLPKRTPSIDHQALTLGYTTMHTYRNGTLLWAGEIQTKSGARIDSVVQYGAKDWFSLFKDVPAFGEFHQVDPSEIIEELINDAAYLYPYADFGVRMGVMETTQPRDRSFDMEDMKKCIEGLTASRIQNGVDIEVTADKKFNVFARKGRVLEEVSFELGRNIIDYWITEDASKLATFVAMIGAGDGEAALVAGEHSPEELQQSFRLRATILSRKDISNLETLESHARQELQQRQVPRQLVTIHVDAALDPGWGAYSVGDTVRIKIDDGLNQIDDYFRLYGIELTRSPQGKETAKLITSPQ